LLPPDALKKKLLPEWPNRIINAEDPSGTLMKRTVRDEVVDGSACRKVDLLE